MFPLRRRVATHLLERGYRYAQSHQNDPLGCAVAREVLATIQEEDLIARSNEVGSHFLSELRRLAENFELIREVRGRGLMIVMELEFGSGSSLAHLVFRQLLGKGFLVRLKPEANLLRFYPPLIIGNDEIAWVAADLEEILEAMA
jgi:acetylornithine aminotransferase